MQVRSLDHANVRTANLDAMIEWYGRVLGLKPGARPDFDFPGAWLYAGDDPIVHLVGVGRTTRPQAEVQLEHFALGATGLKRFLAHLDAEGETYRVGRLPGAHYGEVQVNVHDPDGNHIHVDFAAAEAEGLKL